MHPDEPTREIRPSRAPAARRLPRFAPVSDEPSTALRVATGYVRITGVATLVLGTIALGVGIARGDADGAPVAYALGSATIVATGVGALWTARLLERKRRLGAVVAIATLVAPVVARGTGGVTMGGVLFSLAGAAILASVWNELE